LCDFQNDDEDIKKDTMLYRTFEYPFRYESKFRVMMVPSPSKLKVE
jgi:hypothetical protein